MSEEEEIIKKLQEAFSKDNIQPVGIKFAEELPPRIRRARSKESYRMTLELFKQSASPLMEIDLPIKQAKAMRSGLGKRVKEIAEFKDYKVYMRTSPDKPDIGKVIVSKLKRST